MTRSYSRGDMRLADPTVTVRPSKYNRALDMRPSLPTRLAARLLAGCARVAGEPINHVTPAEQSAGWRLLFDGQSFRGWRGYQGQPIRTWRIADGLLTRFETPKQDVPRGF